MTPSGTEVVHRPDRNRFDLRVDGRLASWLDYTVGRSADHTTGGAPDQGVDGDVWVLTHTVTLPDLRGHGLAERLVAHVVATARGQGVRVHPVCPFVVSWLNGHPEHADIVV